MMTAVRCGLLQPNFSLLSFTPICYTSNMSGKQIFQGAQNVVISGGTFNNADTVCEALMSLITSQSIDIFRRSFITLALETGRHTMQ